MSRGAAGAGVVLVIVLLGACTQEDPPASLPSTPPSTTSPAPTTSAPPTASPAPTGAPDVPAAAQQQTPDGAAAFVNVWFDALNFGYATMDTAPFLAMADDSCLTCSALAQTVDSVASRGNRISGGEITVKNLDPAAIASDGSTTVSALFGAAELSEVTQDGGLVGVIEADGGDVSYLIDLAWSGTTWQIESARLLG